MGEEENEPEETDFRQEIKNVNRGLSYSPMLRELDDLKTSNRNVGLSMSMFNKQQNGNKNIERLGSSVETDKRGLQRKNSETIFNLEY